MATSASLEATVAGLTWDCSAEFDATVGQAISFGVGGKDTDAFISFPNWISRTGAMVSFEVRKGGRRLRKAVNRN